MLKIGKFWLILENEFFIIENLKILKNYTKLRWQNRNQWCKKIFFQRVVIHTRWKFSKFEKFNLRLWKIWDMIKLKLKKCLKFIFFILFYWFCSKKLFFFENSLFMMRSLKPMKKSKFKKQMPLQILHHFLVILLKPRLCGPKLMKTWKLLMHLNDKYNLLK